MALAQRTYWLLVLRAELQARRGDLSVVKGLRIGAAPGADLSLKRLPVEAGIDAERDRMQIGPVPRATGAGVSFGLTAAKALAEGQIDGFWANATGAEIAVRHGVGTVILDVRRGDGPPAARHYTFPALVAAVRSAFPFAELVSGPFASSPLQRQTDNFRPGTAGCRVEADFVFRP
jgi:NitT/TauT family transport system substrate-binding protein